MIFHARCPHCGARQAHEASGDVLPTDRQPDDAAGEPLYEVSCVACGAVYDVQFRVSERPRLSALSSYALAQLRQRGRALARLVRSYIRRPVRPEIACPGCDRRYGGPAFYDYPQPLQQDGLCSVCSQELRRQLAARRRV